MVECECEMWKKAYNKWGCFNRYMVECEYCKIVIHKCNYLGFNRYMVECEYTMQKLAATTATVLIDTWWNVNNIYRNAITKVGCRFNRYMVECEC